MKPSISGHISLDSFLTMPLVKFVGLASILLTSGWLARDYAQTIRGGIDNATYAINSVRDEVRRMRADVYTRTDHRMWSYELEKANKGAIVVPKIPSFPPAPEMSPEVMP